jgi:Flp pilus assembly pilin Flp
MGLQLRFRRGATAAEYGILAASISVVILGSAAVLGVQARWNFIYLAVILSAANTGDGSPVAEQFFDEVWAEASQGAEEMTLAEVEAFRSLIPPGLEDRSQYTVEDEFDWAVDCGDASPDMNQQEFGYMFQFVDPTEPCP